METCDLLSQRWGLARLELLRLDNAKQEEELRTR
jgi:hypothetical protein